ncbi:hypothetical protein [Mycobacterium sp.]|jgi:hypothetical protein|uniref:hypothetical protein n=1 Tax=Mycobacterium sp. TaxID=1785 RepID=UPI002D2B718C|nr:hypothetical protein [Mycobacterium sp.]HZA08586.1 hypothetical protein [Mycobacterium sp.]
MSIIEVNVAGFQFTRCTPDAPGTESPAWHITRIHHIPRFPLRRRAPRLRVA